MIGLPIAPAHSTTRSASIRSPVVSTTARARPAVTSTWSTVTPARISRFGRSRAGARYAMAVLWRTPSTWLTGREPTPTAPGALRSSTRAWPRSAHASMKACMTGRRSSPVNRRIGTGPPVPCHSPPTGSSSSRLKYGRTASQDHWSLPRPTQRSKSLGYARIALLPLTEEEPPMTLPRGTGTTPLPATPKRGSAEPEPASTPADW